MLPGTLHEPIVHKKKGFENCRGWNYNSWCLQERCSLELPRPDLPSLVHNTGEWKTQEHIHACNIRQGAWERLSPPFSISDPVLSLTTGCPVSFR